MDKTIRTAPEIRFPGFKEPWEQRRLGNLGTTFTGLSGKAKQDFGHGEAQFVTYMNVYTNPISKLNMTEHVEIDNRQNKVQFGDIFFTTSSETPEEVGMSSVWLDNSDNTYLNSFCFGFRPKTSLSPYYMAYMLRSAGVREKIIFLAQGISRYNISKNRMMNIEVPLPTLNEQEKIGAFFKSVDALIFLHQRKHDFLQELKRGMLQVMFPQKGEKVPKVRFPGFTSPWEQRKLGELGEIMTGSTPSTSNSEYYSEDGIPWVTPTDINSQTISDTPRKLSEEGMKVGRVVPANTILCTCIASIGKNALLTVKGSFNQQINCLTPNEYNDAYFLLTESVFWSNIMKRMAAAGTMQIVNKTEFSELTTTVPKLEEQKKIGQYFRALDHLITLHQRKLEQLREMKKGLLQKMFI